MLPAFISHRSKLSILAALFLLLFVISAFIGMQNAYDPALSWPVLVAILFSGSLFLVIAGSKISPWNISKGLVIMAGVVAVYFITQYSYFDYPLEQGYASKLGRLTSLFMSNLVFFTPHLNAIASFLEGILFIGLAVVFYSSRTRWIWLALTLIIAYGLRGEPG